MLTQVFELFTQLPENQHPSHRGLGIGLSLVKRIVEMHGGMVEARHATAGGAEFVVRIPLAVDQLPNAVSAKKVSEELPVKCCRVLVVDDNADAADSLAMLLAAAGHVTCVAYDGQAAMERARTFSPTAILLDLGMPGIDGFEVARRIRGLPGGEQIVLIALTGWGQERDRHRTSAAGFDVHLVKPVTASDLQTALGLVPRFGSECANDERFDHRSIKSYVSHEKANIDRDEKQCDLIGVDDTRRSKERISQISHDIVGCLFGIRCATDVLNGLQLNETSARMVRGISNDCQKIQDLIAAAQVIWIHQE
jgi:CheY-like chemotaxis protein